MLNTVCNCRFPFAWHFPSVTIPTDQAYYVCPPVPRVGGSLTHPRKHSLLRVGAHGSLFHRTLRRLLHFGLMLDTLGYTPCTAQISGCGIFTVFSRSGISGAQAWREFSLLYSVLSSWRCPSLEFILSSASSLANQITVTIPSLKRHLLALPTS